jgi:undecaprenyl-diphosphatase
MTDGDSWLAGAQWVGAHAVAVFVLLLGTLLLAVWLLCTAWHGPLLRRSRALPAPAGLLLGAIAGFAIVVGAAAGFAEIGEHLVDGAPLSRLDEALAASVGNHVGSGTLRWFALLTHLADPPVLALLGLTVSAWLWWRRQPLLVLGWVLALGGNALLNPMLKHIFERVRPLHDDGLVAATGYSFPSGHTSGATVAYGMLAYVLSRTLPAAWHLPAVLVASALAFTVGSSRVLLRVHFASDVLAGFASGSAWLMVCILSAELSRRWRSLPPRPR